MISNGSHDINQEQLDMNRSLVSTVNSEAQAIKRSKSRTLVQLKHMSYLDNLVGKRVITCEKSELGYVIAIDKLFITILHTSKQKYVIPTHYIREYDQEKIMVDISNRYLYHYLSEQNLQ
ncbi:MAG TPA: hypothetical protein VKA95_04025 [Nitrososphaeraceae archaeon]|nr:hypothetical protein [Nitrososphaeraceae archaeon]